jgi:hypothetical protein
MNGPSRMSDWLHDRAERGPQILQDSVAHLVQLWRTFEESGAISAYIAYRLHLAHLSYGERQHLTHWKRGHWQ